MLISKRLSDEGNEEDEVEIEGEGGVAKKGKEAQKLNEGMRGTISRLVKV